jgi:hypothetical protein
MFAGLRTFVVVQALLQQCLVPNASLSPPPSIRNGQHMAWNVSAETEMEYQARVCSERCNGTTKVLVVHEQQCGQCLPCTCEPFCHIEGTCCLNLDESWPPAPANLQRSACLSRPVGRRLMNPSLTFVQHCDPSFPLSHPSYHLCAPSDLLPMRPDTKIPVTSLITNVTYLNEHCAACNYDNSDVGIWPMLCIHNQYLYDALTDNEYNYRSLQFPELCGTRPDFYHMNITNDHYHKCILNTMTSPTSSRAATSLDIGCQTITKAWSECSERAKYHLIRHWARGWLSVTTTRRPHRPLPTSSAPFATALKCGASTQPSAIF